MIIALGENFGAHVNKQIAMSMLGQWVGAGVGIYGAKAVLGIFPVLGNLANAAISGGYTEGLGWWSVRYFDKPKQSMAA